MAERPIYVPAIGEDGCVKRVDFQIPWAGGFAEIQKKKNIESLHEAARCAGYSPLLEISTKSDVKAGRHLSAFHLKVLFDGTEIPLESAYQGSKVFESGGPFEDLYWIEPRHAKRDPRLRESGPLRAFRFDGREFPLLPKTVFYDWLYLSAIFQYREWLFRRITVDVAYAGFTDIEFNPAKSINCQARSCALFVALMGEGKLESYMASAEAFLQAMTSHTVTGFDARNQESLGIT